MFKVAYGTPIFALRIAQLVLAIVILGLLAYETYEYNQAVGNYTSDFSGAFGVGLFSACLTIIFGVWYFVALMAAPKAYHIWGALSLEIAAVIFWLISFALLAVSVNDYKAILGPHTVYDYYDGVYVTSAAQPADVFLMILEAALALAVIEWVLFLVTLVLVGIGHHRERRSGVAAAGTTGAATAAADQEKGVPMQANPQHQTYDQQYAQPQQTYEQQYATQPQQHYEQTYGPDGQAYAQPAAYHDGSQQYVSPEHASPAQTYTTMASPAQTYSTTTTAHPTA